MVDTERSAGVSWSWTRYDFTMDCKRNMPAYKVGRLWKFKLSEVDDWIRSGGAADDNSGTENNETRLTDT